MVSHRLKGVVTAIALALGVQLVPAIMASAEPLAPAISADASGKTTPDGQPLGRYAKRGARPQATASLPAPPATSDTPQPECPIQLKCKFVPAAYQQVDPADKSNYGNYDVANRPADGQTITSVVIHDTEGSLAHTIEAFQNPTWYASAHYVIDRDGTVYQMVRTKDVAWHAGNWYLNIHSIGIEHVGEAVNGRTDYTPAMYQSSAILVRYLAGRFHFALDRQHLLGHDNVPAPTAALSAGMHWDPGAFWNWQYYQALLGVPVVPTAGPDSKLVTVAPNWLINRPAVTQCDPTGACTSLPTQPTNFVYLRSAPSDTAPLLTDIVLHPDGAAGTTRIDDWSAHVAYGQQFAVAERQGSWVAIWHGGRKGWFKNPGGVLNALPTRGQAIRPRAGLTSIPVYGRAYPEPAAYAGTQVPVQSVVPLQYSIAAGQQYATTGPVPTDYWWAWTIDSSLPDDHKRIVGSEAYLEIQYNYRVAFVKKSDVELVG